MAVPTAQHQSPAFSLPSFRMKQIPGGTWGAGGNTLTITDSYIFPNSVVLAYVTGSTPAAGNWSFAVTKGQCVITSTNAESSTLPVSYIVL